jgi:hypothetical protein
MDKALTKEGFALFIARYCSTLCFMTDHSVEELKKNILSDLNALLREELITYDKWLSKNNWGIGLITPEQSVDNYLKSQQ